MAIRTDIPGSSRRSWALLAVLVGSAAVAAPAAAQEHAGHTMMDGADSSAVAAAVERFHAALASGDSATVLALLAPEARILESGGVETRAEYSSHHLPADMAFASAVARERGPVEVTVNGDVAWAVSTSLSQGTYRDRPVDSRGAELVVLTREEGAWRIQAVHWSSRSAG